MQRPRVCAIYVFYICVAGDWMQGPTRVCLLCFRHTRDGWCWQTHCRRIWFIYVHNIVGSQARRQWVPHHQFEFAFSNIWQSIECSPSEIPTLSAGSGVVYAPCYGVMPAVCLTTGSLFYFWVVFRSTEEDNSTSWRGTRCIDDILSFL